MIRVHDGQHIFSTAMLELRESGKALDIHLYVSLNIERKAAARLNAVLRG
jgi:hypothetical protein